MKKIILMCFFGFILSDTIIYFENGREYKIENVKVKSQNLDYIRYTNWEGGVKAIDASKVSSIIDKFGNEILFSSSEKVDYPIDVFVNNHVSSGVYLKKSGDNFMTSVLLQILSAGIIVVTADEGTDMVATAGVLNLGALIFQIFGITNLQKAGNALEIEQNKLLMDSNTKDLYTDIVYLKDGSIINGEILEQNIGEFIKIMSAGNILVIKTENIDSISKVK